MLPHVSAQEIGGSMPQTGNEDVMVGQINWTRKISLMLFFSDACNTTTFVFALTQNHLQFG